MTHMSLRRFAAHMGVTLGAVQKAIKSGRIPREPDGKINPAVAEAAWRANTDLSRQSMSDMRRQADWDAQKSGGNQLAQPDDLAGAALDLDDEPDDLGTDSRAAAVSTATPVGDAAHRGEILSSRARRERTRAEKEDLELAQLRGRLVDVDQAKRLAFTMFRTLRDALLNVPVRVADQLAAETDPARIEEVLIEELIGALQSIDATRLMDEQEADDDGGD